jgi:endoglucanase
MRAFAARGVSVFRVPVRWERLQPDLNRALSADEMARLDKVIDTANRLGISVIIDVHNYGRYARQPIGSTAVPPAALSDLWERLARRYKDNPRVIFGMMNEPVRVGADDWAAIANDVMAGIRQTGARNLVLVPGAYWSGAHSWTKAMRANPSNAQALESFVDPGNNFAFDIHQYFDAYSSGTSTSCVAPDKVKARLAVATDWLRANGKRAMLTEFGAGSSPDCQLALKTALEHLRDNPQWIGWTAWASSAWFGPYPFNLYPLQTPAPPQLDVLTPFFAK